jgi:predicted metal-dependent hydrolase
MVRSSMTPPLVDPCLAHGVQLFNQGHFFEAHEAWEKAWKRSDGDERTFYQGIIQAAAALLHVQRRNYAGAMSVYGKSRRNLDKLPARWVGIELAQFRADLIAYFAALRTPLDEQGDRGDAAMVPAKPLPIIGWACDS